MENSYIYTVNITSEGFKEKIISSFKTLENCEESEAGRVILYLLTYIFHYYSFTKDNNEREEYYQKIKNILDKYDEFICEKDKLRILFRINNKEIFNYYFNKNKEQLIKTMENVVLVNFKLGDFESYDYQGYLDSKYGVGKYYVIDLNFAELSNSYNIFATFREQLNLFEKNIGMFDYDFLFNNMSFFELESLAIKEVKKDNKYLKKLVHEMFLEYMDGNVEIDKLYSVLSDNNIKKVFFTVAEEYLTFYEALLFDESLTDKLDRILALSMDDNIKFDIDFDNIVNFFSVNCFIALKELMKIPPKERKNSVLYLNCFKAFLKYMVCRFECELENEDVIVLSNLFHRLVANGLRKSLSILLITNKKELYHYFKSNEFYVSSFSLEQIKNYNAKQYLNLKKMNNGSKNQRLVLCALIYL